MNSETPKISVVMPAYNAATFVADAVNSILAQSFAGFELIVVEDGSTDATREVLKSFTDPRIAVVANPANLGEAGAFNIGLALAHGEFVARFDADDIAEPNRLELQLAFMTAHPEITVCGSDGECFGEITGPTGVPETDADIKANFMAGMSNIVNPTAVIRRKFLTDTGVRANPNYRTACDLGFWIECMRKGAVFANIKQTLIRYRTNARNFGGEFNPARREILTQLAGEFFPALSRSEAAALSRIFFLGEPMAMSFAEIRRTLAACEKALGEGTSYYGENRDLLRQHVTNYSQAFLKMMKAPAPRN